MEWNCGCPAPDVGDVTKLLGSQHSHNAFVDSENVDLEERGTHTWKENEKRRSTGLEESVHEEWSNVAPYMNVCYSVRASTHM